MPAAAAAQAPANIGELFATEASANGPVMLAGTGIAVASGSELAAGRSPATLRLERGGEVKICPYSRITVSAGDTHGPLMFAMGVSSAELSYPVNSLTDFLVTPDFRISLAGPGTFHFAVGVNSRGDTCVKPLRGNSGNITVSALMGGETYQMRPDEAVLFSGGKINARMPVPICGCSLPQQTPPVQRAAAGKPATDPAAPVPPPPPGEVHMSVEAPLVFRGDQAAQPSFTIAKVRFSTLPNINLLQEKVQPTVVDKNKQEVAARPKEKKGFFGGIRSFFGSIFHHKGNPK